VIRILVVDDYEEWRSRVRLLLEGRPEWQVVCEISDGLDAVQKAQELKPDLILLDIGLPKLNGIEAARRIHKLVPESKILFLSTESDVDVVREALNLGVSGYVVKVNASKELLIAVEAVLQGERFVSDCLAARDLSSEGAKSNFHFRFEFDAEHKIVTGKFHGAVTSESIKEFYRIASSMVAAAEFQGSIIDFSSTTSFELTPRMIRELAALAPIDPVASRPRIIVAPNALIFGLARLFQAIGKATRPNLHVVRTPRQALALLGVATPHFQAIPAAPPS
jgi:DNA-binding NarL/FixJ family response regulator